MEYKDYYKVLGVPRTATQADVKKAFRRLARQHHPDRNPGDRKAEQAFKDVNEANEVLSDPEKRKLYDELGANWEAYARAGATGSGAGAGSPFGAGGPFAGFGGQGFATGPGGVRYEFRTSGDAGEFSDFFRMFFGGEPAAAGSPGTRTRARQARAGASPSVEELLGGRTGGGGGGFATRGTDGRPAPTEATAEIGLEEAFHGTTRVVDVDGRRLEVKIPPGVDSGSRIRIAGQGGPAGAASRDLHILTRVRPHAVFTRNGADVTREVRVTLREALLGAEVPVGTLSGRVLLTLPAGTQNGRTFRLAGQGMPRLKGGGRGDLYVKVQVVLPPSLTDEAKAAARRFLDLADQANPRGEA